MAIPTFTSITPIYGPSGGGSLVTIIGTNFRVPATPEESVRVTFDGIYAVRTDVISTTQLNVKVPHSHKKGKELQVDNFAAIDIVITNLDSSGVPIPGETVTASKAYTYRRSPSRLPRATEEHQVYKQVINETLWAFQRQITPNVAIGTSIDFGEHGQATTLEAKLPGITLIGPRIQEDMINRHRWADFEEIVIVGNPDKYEQFRNAFVTTFEFDAIIATNKRREMYAMIQAVIELFLRTPYLKVPITPSSPNAGYYNFPFVLMDPPDVAITEPNSDLIVGGSVFQVRCIPFRRDEADEFVYRVNEGEMDVVQGLDLDDPDFEIILFATS
jgi:hypothetical protein